MFASVPVVCFLVEVRLLVVLCLLHLNCIVSDWLLDVDFDSGCLISFVFIHLVIGLVNLCDVSFYVLV